MKKGFTLAEVLITLGIIGVVAALTIPTLVQNYQKKQWVSGLQKGYAQIQQVFKLVMAKDGVDYLSQTSLFNTIANDEISYSEMHGDQSAFISELGKYIKITKYCNPVEAGTEDPCFNTVYEPLFPEEGYVYKQKNRLKIFTADGMIYFFRFNKKSSNKTIGRIEVDVNGEKGPNTFGRDCFEFILMDNGEILLPGSKNWVDYNNGSHWSETPYFCGSFMPGGDYCAARIFENGWRMDY